MKLTHGAAAGLVLLALGACRSSEPAPQTPPEAGAETAPEAEVEEVEPVEEAVTVAAVPASLPEVRYYEIADT